MLSSSPRLRIRENSFNVAAAYCVKPPESLWPTSTTRSSFLRARATVKTRSIRSRRGNLRAPLNSQSTQTIRPRPPIFARSRSKLVSTGEILLSLGSKMRTTDLNELMQTVETLRGELHPDLDARFLEQVIRAEAENPEDDAEAIRVIELALKALLNLSVVR